MYYGIGHLHEDNRLGPASRIYHRGTFQGANEGLYRKLICDRSVALIIQAFDGQGLERHAMVETYSLDELRTANAGRIRCVRLNQIK